MKQIVIKTERDERMHEKVKKQVVSTQCFNIFHFF